MGFLSGLFKFILPFAGWALFGPVGFLLGGVAASLLFPNKEGGQAPPQSIKVQTSTYGVTIPIVYGQYRLAGNIIWSTDIRPITVPGVKTGVLFFKKKTPDTTYYRASWAVAFCEGPVTAITRIWFDGAEVYDVRDGTDSEWRARSLAKVGRSWDGINIYLGTEEETNDAEILLDTDINADELSPNRGICKIVFVNWNLSNLGNQIPNVTAEVVTQADKTFSKWVDVSDEMTIANEGRVQSASCIAYDKSGVEHLIIAGGYKFSIDAYGVYHLERALNYTRQGTMNADGSLTWTAFGYNLLHPVAELELVFAPAVSVFGTNTVWAFGGFSEVNNESFYDEPLEGNGYVSLMQQCCYIDDSDPIFISTPLKGTAMYDGVIEQIQPFPRNGHAAAFHIAKYPFLYGIWMYGGLTQGDHSLFWNDSSWLRDLWFFNGTSWQCLTEIQTVYDHLGNESKVTVDGGASYRAHHSMLSYNGELFLAGGLGPAGGLWESTPLRDVYKLSIDSVNFIRFTRICLDVMKDFELAEEVEYRYYVAGLTGWRGKLIALVSRNLDTSEDFSLWESVDNGKTWHLCYKASYEIYACGSGTYFLDGDYTDEIVAGDRISAMGDAIDPHLAEYTVSNVTFQLGLTILTLEGESGTPSPQQGTIYVHDAQGFPQAVTEYVGKSMTFNSLNETLYLTGGFTDTFPIPGDPDVPGLMIQKLENSSTTGSSITLAEVVSDICVRAGMTEDQINVDDLREKTIKGFCVYNRTTIRSVLEQLQQFGFFDCVESDGKLKFVLRGGDAVVTIANDDLGAHVTGSEKPNDLEYEKVQDLELPQQVDVVYPDLDTDYNENTQTSRRLVTYSNKITTVNTSIVMDADEAARMAYILLYDAWNCRDTMTIYLSGMKYLYLDPADVISFVVDENTYTGRITRIDYESTGVLKVQLVLENLDMYAESEGIVGSPGTGTGSNPVHLTGLNTTAYFLDIPMLSESSFGLEDHFGFYFVAANTDTADEGYWQGAYLYWYDDLIEGKSVSYTELGNVTLAVTHGTCDTILGTSPSSVYWDDKNTLDVSILHGTLATDTEEAMHDTLSNLAAVGSAATGWELIQFRDVEDLGSDTYRLSHLLRGCFGTEWRTDTHVADEKFILLERDKLEDIQLSSNSVNRELKYVVVPFGRGTAEQTPVAFTCTAVRKKPYSPIHLEATKLENGDWRIEWMRRCRGLSSYFGGKIVPITDGHAYGQYEIEFTDEAGTVLAVQTVDVVSLNEDLFKPYFLFSVEGFYVYQAGKRVYQFGQTDVYGSEVDTIRVTVYQLSSTVGRGYGTSAVFTV